MTPKLTSPGLFATALIHTCLLLSACMSQYTWVKPGGTPSQLASAKLGCDERALDLYPITLDTRTSYRTQTVDYVCTTAATRDTPAEKGVCQREERVPETTRFDINQSQRSAYVNTCLASQGWVYTKLES
jgi:hypothetical protein